MTAEYSGPRADDRVRWRASVDSGMDDIRTAGGSVLSVSVRAASVTLTLEELTEDEARRAINLINMMRGGPDEYAPKSLDSYQEADLRARAAVIQDELRAELAKMADARPKRTQTKETPVLDRFEGLDI